jgi:hypothetical protein
LLIVCIDDREEYETGGYEQDESEQDPFPMLQIVNSDGQQNHDSRDTHCIHECHVQVEGIVHVHETDTEHRYPEQYACVVSRCLQLTIADLRDTVPEQHHTKTYDGATDGIQDPHEQNVGDAEMT